MNRTANNGKALTDEEIAAIADDLESTDFTPEDFTKIKKSRRRSPASATPRQKSSRSASRRLVRDALHAHL